MQKIFLVFMTTVTVVLAYDVVPHDADYYTKRVRNTQLIYTENNMPFAQHAAEVEMSLQPLYEDSFGYQMDETLYVGLTSKNNQIANGFSTQWPNNRQINYMGGAMKLDYFTSTSWLDTLLYHETTHNYQLNAKDNLVSSSLHSVIGNGAFFIPWFSVPNVVESSFLLEGNAVLNESWHNNGGRLYSGRFKIATLMQAKAGYLNAARVYNDNYYFLYGSHFYTLGGFYNQYLAENYELKHVNGYWKEHSEDWFWPFFTNNAMERAIGVDFETSLEAWSQQMEAEAALVVETQGKPLAHSQYFSPLNSDRDGVYFIINENGREIPEFVYYDKAKDRLSQDKASYLQGRVIRIGMDSYATQGSNYTSPWRIHEGLFDADGLIVKGTQSKVIQGYLSDGRAVYFDVASSYEQPQLYVGGAFYNQVNSSVVIDAKDNLYYFKQSGKTRTLYKNKKPLYAMQGFYGTIADIDKEGRVYFISNTEHGSGLFRFNGTGVEKMHPADTIIDARLIGDNEALVAVMGSNAFKYEKIKIAPILGAPYEVKLFEEDKAYFQHGVDAKSVVKTPKLDLENNYYSMLDMHYSGTNLALGNDTDAGFLYNVSVNFGDPLGQNALSMFVRRNLDELTLAGGSYQNNQYFIQFSALAYGVIANDTDLSTRDYGVSAQAVLPLLKMGYYGVNLSAAYFQDYTTDARQPFSAQFEAYRREHFGVSALVNFLVYGALYATSERGDTSFGGKLSLAHELPFESVIKMNAHYSKSDTQTPFFNERGVKVTASQSDTLLNNDPSTIVMPSTKYLIYAKEVEKLSVSASTVLNGAFYFFTFPMSLRREVASVGYSYYTIKGLSQPIESNEISASMLFDTFWMNKLPIPISVNYYYNDNLLLADEHTVRVSLGLAF